MAALYLAPMEDVTGDLFRRVLHKHFGGVDRYFTPFLSPVHGLTFKTRQGREVDPSHNAGMPTVPQVLTNDADAAAHMIGLLADLGYGEVNLNLGCPSGTVVGKGRGSGFLRDPEGMERFFDRLFAKELPVPVSVKTRVGFASTDEWPRLLEIYNRYPLSELIVHARVREDWYRGLPRMDAWDYAVQNSRIPLCYNGDIRTAADCAEILRKSPGVTRVMIGRGAVTNPGIFREIAEERAMTEAELKSFHDELHEAYVARYGPKDTLFKMKEFWGYLGDRYEDPERVKRRVRKCGSDAEYMAVAAELWNC